MSKNCIYFLGEIRESITSLGEKKKCLILRHRNVSLFLQYLYDCIVDSCYLKVQETL